MTRKQQLALESFVNATFDTFSFGHPETHEIKELVITEWEDLNTVHVSIEIGRIGDEGTMASVYARDYATVMIGKNGGYSGRRKGTDKLCPLNLHEAVWFEKRQNLMQERKREKASR